MDLFEHNQEALAPLAHRMRPQSLDEVAGQSHLIGKGRFLTEILKSSHLPSLILWGPPGSGKTTLAQLLAQHKGFRFASLSAVSSGIKDVKQVVAQAQEQLKLYSQKTILFLDEIHRFNKAQQDAFLPHLENGTLILIGATTENPSFEVVSALLSRCKVIVLKQLDQSSLRQILKRCLTDKQKGLGQQDVSLSPTAEDLLLKSCDGDARRMLTTLEAAFYLAKPHPIDENHIANALQQKVLTHDKNGEDHYNVISAFIKSMRSSDPDAAVYYLARLLEAGEDPLFIARRMVIFASEDIGNADPQAVQVAMSCMQAFHFIGLAEGWIPLSQSATYLACAPKSNASYQAYKKAKADVGQHGPLPVPLHLRNAPTGLMKNMGYGQGYQYAHDQQDQKVTHHHLPEKIKDQKYYQPTDNGYEKEMKKWLKR